MAGRIPVVIPAGVDNSELPSHTRLWTPEFSQVASGMFKSVSFHKTAAHINRIQHRTEKSALSTRTLNDDSQLWGADVISKQRDMALTALTAAGFDPGTGKPTDVASLPQSLTNPIVPSKLAEAVHEQFKQALDEFVERYPDKASILSGVFNELECPEQAVIMMIDDVLVTRQNTHRAVKGRQASKETQMVHTTVVWIRTREGVYVLQAENTREGCIMALGYLLRNHLLENRQLIVFSDGAREIRDHVSDVFSFHRPLAIKLDWYHLVRRISECLSMGLWCGKQNRDKNQAVIKSILNPLWYGDVDGAVAAVDAIDQSMIRVHKKVEECRNYLIARKPYLYCYAARKITGLINSSNRCEAANDQSTSMRQKGTNMSWSVSGSHGLTELTMLGMNGEEREWYEYHSLRFTPLSKPANDPSQGSELKAS